MPNFTSSLICLPIHFHFIFVSFSFPFDYWVWGQTSFKPGRTQPVYSLASIHFQVCFKHINPYFLISPKQCKKSKFWKNKKNPWRYHHFTYVYQNLWSEDIRFLRLNWCNCYFSFWAIFCPCSVLNTRETSTSKSKDISRTENTASALKRGQQENINLFKVINFAGQSMQISWNYLWNYCLSHWSQNI